MRRNWRRPQKKVWKKRRCSNCRRQFQVNVVREPQYAADNRTKIVSFLREARTIIRTSTTATEKRVVNIVRQAKRHKEGRKDSPREFLDQIRFKRQNLRENKEKQTHYLVSQIVRSRETYR